MASPLEFRHFFRKYTLDDCAAGLQPIRQQIDGRVELFAPPVLQFRHRDRDRAPSDGSTQRFLWTEWADVPYVRDGDIEP
jgi:hypothetical protein